MTRTAFYAGSFDPVTNGHLDVLRGGCRLVDRVVIAVGAHPGKAPLFSVEERVKMLNEVFGPVAAETGRAIILRLTPRGGTGPTSCFEACAMATISITRCRSPV
jgi:cytidyltransferase-like protein